MNKRHQELSEKIFNLGVSLNKESLKNNDENIELVGKAMVLISGIVDNTEDLLEFDFLCSMFASKKLMEEIPKEFMFTLIDKLKEKNDDLEGLIDDMIDDL